MSTPDRCRHGPVDELTNDQKTSAAGK